MSVSVYAYLERKAGDHWELVHALAPSPEFAGQPVPTNIAPGSWGKRNFAHTYEVSGERGLPEDLSNGLSDFVRAQFPEPNRPSWMTLAEIVQHLKADAAGTYAHFDCDTLIAQGAAPASDLRVVFWAD